MRRLHEEQVVANPESRLAHLREQQVQIEAHIARLENQHKKQMRKDDTRLKILSGPWWVRRAGQLVIPADRNI